MNKHLKYLGAAFLGMTVASFAQAQQFTGEDVGNPTLKGSATINGDGTITIVGGGNDIWDSSDNFYYYNTPTTGYYIFDAIVRVQDLDGPDGWTKGALMARFIDPAVGSPQGGDPHIMALTTRTAGQNEVRVGVRTARNSGSDEFTPSTAIRPAYPNQWLRITRNGSVFDCYQGTDGKNWTLITEIDTATNKWKGSDNGYFFGNAPADNVRIGFAVTAHNDSDSSGGVATISDWKLTLTPLTSNPTTVTFTKQPAAATTAYDGTSVSFSVAATNNAVPNIVPCTYQWYKNGVAISGATQPQLGVVANLSETGAKYYCKATASAKDALVTAYSVTNTLTVLNGVVYTNGLKWEYWANATRASVENGSAGAPTSVRVSSSFDMPANTGINNYAQRVSGFFIPPTDGNYTFYMASDDDSDFFISSNSNPANKYLITQQTSWNDPRMWNSGGNVSQRCSDSYSPDNGITVPWSDGIALKAGQRYYIEGVMAQGGGGDNFSVTYILTGSTAPTDGTYSMLQATNGNVAFQTGLSTNLAITTQPVSTKVFAGDNAKFSVAFTSDSELTPTIQWYTNNQPIANATGNTIKFLTSMGDNGDTVYAVVKVPETSLIQTSTIVTLTVQQPVFEPGLVKREVWLKNTRAAVENGTAPDPDYITTSYYFEGPTSGLGDGYAERMSCLFVPPTTGAYSFVLTSDDDGDLFISTDASPANKYLIAQQTSWSGNRQWASGDQASQRNSTTYTPDSGTTVPYANGIQLVAGKKYYLEAVTHNGSGGYDLGVTYYKTATEAAPDDNALSTLTGNVIGFNAPVATYVAFTQQPTNVTAPALAKVTFTAGATSDGTISVGDNLSTFVLYQWQKNGVDIPGATKSTYTTSFLKNTDDQAQFVCKIRALGMSWSNSNPAVLTVIKDTTAPVVSFVSYRTNNNQTITSPVIDITFNKTMDLDLISKISNYSVAGAIVVQIIVNSNNLRQVELVLSETPSQPVSVSFTGLKDYLSNVLANTTVQAHTPELINTDIGVSGTDPSVPGFMIASSTNSYTIICEGSDIYNSADGFNFSYQLKTNDFDVVVRHVSTTHTSQWSKGGLMVRETLDADSREWSIVNDPASADGIAAPDGTGLGNNTTESNTRNTTGGSTGSWGFTNTVPAYPNAWLRLKRVGQELSSYFSTNGTTWTLAATNNPTKVGSSNALPVVVYVGIACTAHNNDTDFTGTLKYLYTGEFADYNSNYIYVEPPKDPATLTATVVGSNIVISWTPAGGHLESSPALGAGADWTHASTSNPATIPTTGTTKFFRVVNP